MEGGPQRRALLGIHGADATPPPRGAPVSEELGAVEASVEADDDEAETWSRRVDPPGPLASLVIALIRLLRR